MGTTVLKKRPTAAKASRTKGIAKPKVKEAAGTAMDPESVSEETGLGLQRLPETPAKISELYLADIRPHDLNRDLDGDASIEELAKSIDQLGQLEPITVRLLEGDRFKFELLSGERRFRAMKLLQRETIHGVVVEDTTPAGLVRLAAANSQRKDLDPIQRAELIQDLMKPIELGGSGLSRDAAGLSVGLQSEGGVKNALRILKLPEAIKRYVREGDLGERAIRKLVPFAGQPELMREIEEEMRNNESRVELAADEGWPWWLDSLIEKHTRPMDDEKVSMHNLLKGCWGVHPMLFIPTEEQLRLLNPFVVRDGGETRKLTANCKLWDSLQLPLLKAQMCNARSKSAESFVKTRTATIQTLATMHRKPRALLAFMTRLVRSRFSLCFRWFCTVENLFKNARKCENTGISQACSELVCSVR